ALLAAVRHQGAVLRMRSAGVLLGQMEARPTFKLPAQLRMHHHDLLVRTEDRKEQRVSVPTDLVEQLVVMLGLDISQKEASAGGIGKVDKHAGGEVPHGWVTLGPVRPPLVVALLIFRLSRLDRLRSRRRVTARAGPSPAFGARPRNRR